MFAILGLATTEILGQFAISMIFCASLTYLFMKNKKIIIPKNFNFYILIAFNFFYIIYSISNNNSILLMMYGPVLAYYSGVLIYYFSKNNSKYISKCIMAIVIGFFIHAMLNYFTNLNSLNRNILDFWTKINFAATLQASYVTLIVSLSAYFILCVKKFWIKIISLISIVLSFLYLILLGTRTTFVIFAIVTLFEVFFYLKINGKLREKMKTILIIISSFIVVIYLYNNNYFEIKTTIESSNLFSRFNDERTIQSDESRFETQILGVQSLFNNPFGTKDKVGNLKYVHNMWLDLGKDVGIIPFTFLFIYTVGTIVSLIKLLKNTKIENNYKILISSIYIGMLINFFVEPILEGIPFYFLIYVLINGIIDTQVKELNNKMEEL